MPCTDGGDEDDRIDAKRRHDAMTAMLCGVMSADKHALSYATEWCTHHAQVDLLRRDVRYDWEDKRIKECLRRCDEVADRAHAALCVTPNTGTSP